MKKLTVSIEHFQDLLIRMFSLKYLAGQDKTNLRDCPVCGAFVTKIDPETGTVCSDCRELIRDSNGTCSRSTEVTINLTKPLYNPFVTWPILTIILYSLLIILLFNLTATLVPSDTVIITETALSDWLSNNVKTALSNRRIFILTCLNNLEIQTKQRS